MGIRVQVSEHVILIGDSIFAETSTSVFRRRTEPQRMLDVGNRVRHHRVIDLSKWECFDKRSDQLPDLYLEAAF
jgi:hypothetical protein